MDKKRDRGVMLLISMLLHSMLALLPWQDPWQEKSRPSAVPSTPASSISVVDASQLPTLPASESQPLPAGSSSPPALDAPITETSNSPIDQPAPDATAYSDAVSATTPSAVPATPNSVTPADEAQVEAEWAQLTGYLEGKDEGFGFPLPEIFSNFGESRPANQFFDENNQPKFEVASFFHFPGKTPEQVFEDVVMPELTSNTGFDPQLQENFPAGRAYQMLQGEMLRYLIIVRLREGEGSVLLLSKPLPGLES